MAEHIDDDATPVFLAVVPRWALSRLIGVFACEDPVAKFSAHREDAAEEPLVTKEPEFPDASEPEFVLNDAIFDPGIFTEFGKAQSFRRFDRRWFFAIDRLACLDCFLYKTCAL